MFVLLGNPVYGRWFLDGSDPDVRLVAVIRSPSCGYTYLVCSINVAGRGGRKRKWRWILIPYPYFQMSGFFSTDFAQETLL